MKTIKLLLSFYAFIFCINIMSMHNIILLSELLSDSCLQTPNPMDSVLNLSAACTQLRHALLPTKKIWTESTNELTLFEQRMLNFIITHPKYTPRLGNQLYTLTIANLKNCKESSNISQIVKMHCCTTKLSQLIQYPISREENAEQIESLLKRGANPNYTTYNRIYGHCPLLHIACSNGNVNTAQLLLAYGAKINAIDYQGKSTLFKALHAWKKCLRLELVNLLLSYGINIHNPGDSKPKINPEIALEHYLDVTNPALFPNEKRNNAIITGVLGALLGYATTCSTPEFAADLLLFVSLAPNIAANILEWLKVFYHA